MRWFTKSNDYRRCSNGICVRHFDQSSFLDTANRGRNVSLSPCYPSLLREPSSLPSNVMSGGETMSFFVPFQLICCVDVWQVTGSKSGTYYATGQTCKTFLCDLFALPRQKQWEETSRRRWRRWTHEKSPVEQCEMECGCLDRPNSSRGDIRPR